MWRDAFRTQPSEEGVRLYRTILKNQQRGLKKQNPASHSD